MEKTFTLEKGLQQYKKHLFQVFQGYKIILSYLISFFGSVFGRTKDDLQGQFLDDTNRILKATKDA
jgi:hypothetical protein